MKHAQPILEADTPPREWRLGPEGKAQAQRLARRLAAWAPFALVSSLEPKARETARLVSRELDIPFRQEAGFEEIDRGVLPIVGKQEHEALNKPIFTDMSTSPVGDESGDAAVRRFSSAVYRTVAGLEEGSSLVVVAHGTVISLFVAQHNAVDAWDLWKRLPCTSHVVLRLPGFELAEVVTPPEGEANTS